MKENEQQNFKVVDKRRFSSEGESNEIDVSKSARSAEPENRSSIEDEPMSSIGNNEMPPQEINFPSFLMGMYTQTLIYLGDIPNPDTNKVEQNIDAGKQNIDILSVIEEKTKGNLSPEEEGLFKEILTTLRLQFVKKTKK